LRWVLADVYDYFGLPHGVEGRTKPKLASVAVVFVSVLFYVLLCIPWRGLNFGNNVENRKSAPFRRGARAE
jgi:hypothetical protein